MDVHHGLHITVNYSLYWFIGEITLCYTMDPLLQNKMLVYRGQSIKRLMQKTDSDVSLLLLFSAGPQRQDGTSRRGQTDEGAHQESEAA